MARSFKREREDRLTAWSFGPSTAVEMSRLRAAAPRPRSFLAAGVLLAALLGATGAAHVQAAAVCDTPSAEDTIACSEDATSTADITIDAENVDIDATEVNGIQARHDGTGRITIGVSESTVDTTGRNSAGIRGAHEGSNGDLKITSTNTAITTTGQFGVGIEARQHAIGNTRIEMSGGSITTTGSDAEGIFAYTNQTAGETHINVTVKNGATIVTDHPTPSQNSNNYGVHAFNQKTDVGNVTITLNNSTITTDGHALFGRRYAGPGNITINAMGSSITTKGVFASGINAERGAGEGDIIFTVRDVDIKTLSTEFSPSYSSYDATASMGITAWHKGTGDVTFDVRGGSIMTAGEESYGILVDYDGGGAGDIMVTTSGGNIITTTGPYGHGIVVDHEGTGDARVTTSSGDTITTTGNNAHGIGAFTTPDSGIIAITIGGSVSATGANSRGVRVGSVSAGNKLRG